ncbi:sensor histidine kinase [Nocardioides zeae]|uniref:histidine kinase n=1 Tax=Nocardioides zeae TaxID=1457234 RepID=A0AAJ1TV57_9ACTN|nr:sensor histidine kinase [Nocardioides zeae]MDQ1102871.1 signal transduction histidine kinase/uncharacterized membrane protein [Nocardioides zeae]
MFKVSARTVLELGAELISSDIIAFYELIKNGFDANSQAGVDIEFDVVLTQNDYVRASRKIREAVDEDVSLEQLISSIEERFLVGASDHARHTYLSELRAATTLDELLVAMERAQEKANSITVSDRGHGMSRDDLVNNFLVIGTPSRKAGVDVALRSGEANTPFLGEKGIGRLSAMRLGDRLQVTTSRAGDRHENVLEINWKDFDRLDAFIEEIPVAPRTGVQKSDRSSSGTRIRVSDLSGNWTAEKVIQMCNEEFGRLTDPFVNARRRPRVAVVWNGTRLDIPAMPRTLTDAAHARVVGSYRVVDGQPLLTTTVEVLDLGFEHPPVADSLTQELADLQSTLIGKGDEVSDAALLTVGDFSFEIHWFNRRRLSRVDSVGDGRAIRDQQDQWSGILMFRDGFRVFPYGEEEDDWLELDRRALRRSGYSLNKTQFVGRVNISRTKNPQLVDQTNREGLRETPEQRVLLEIVRYSIQDRLGIEMRAVERAHKSAKIDLSEAKNRVEELRTSARVAVGQLRTVTPKEGRQAVIQVEQTLLELDEFARAAHARIAEVEKESRQMVEMAGVGLMVEVVAHELARATQNSLRALERLRGAELPEKVASHLSTLRVEMISISKRVRVLDPMSVSGRQRREVFSLDALVRETMDAHESQFARHSVRVELDLDAAVRIRAVKGMIVQILENLISNSIYWMDMRSERESRHRPLIKIAVESNPPTLTFEDNGRGVSAVNRDKIFQPFFSLKDTKRRRGLGLFIARDAAEYNGGSLELSEVKNSETGRHHRFVLTLPGGDR